MKTNHIVETAIIFSTQRICHSEYARLIWGMLYRHGDGVPPGQKEKGVTMKVKYISVNDFIKKYGDKPMDTLDWIEAFKSAPEADVVSMDFIDNWFKRHYGTSVNPIREAWERANE